MSDLKSKLPDMKELTGMLGKLFTDVKKSIVEIAQDYKTKHQETEEAQPKAAETKPTEPETAKQEVEPTKTEEVNEEPPVSEEPPKDE